MEKRKKMLVTMLLICIVYLFATCTAILFLYLVYQGEFLEASIVLLIELFLFLIGKELRNSIWVK